MGKAIGITGMIGFMGSYLRDRLSRGKDVEVPYFRDEYFNSRG